MSVSSVLVCSNQTLQCKTALRYIKTLTKYQSHAVSFIKYRTVDSQFSILFRLFLPLMICSGQKFQ